MNSRTPCSGCPQLIASRAYHVRGILIDRDEAVAQMKLLEQVCMIFLDGRPTDNRSSVCHINPVLREERGHGGGIVLVECIVSDKLFASPLLGVLAAMIVLLSSVYAQNRSPLHLEKEISLPGSGGVSIISLQMFAASACLLLLWRTGLSRCSTLERENGPQKSKDLMSRRESFIPRGTVWLQQFRSTRILNLFNLRKAIHVYS